MVAALTTSTLPMPWPVAVLLLAGVSLACTSALATLEVHVGLFAVLVTLSGPTALYFFAGHGGSYALWACGIVLVAIPLAVARIRGSRSKWAYALPVAVWLALGLIFSIPVLGHASG